MWTDAYKKNVELLRGSSGKQLREQMQRLENESPQMFAAVNFLAFAFAEQIEKLDRNEAGDGGDFLALMPKPVVDFAVRTQLVLPTKDELCHKLNMWAAHVSFEKFRRGIIEEPNHYCDD